MVIEVVVGLSAAIAGYFIGRSRSRTSKYIAQEYEQRLKKADQELMDYREQVTEHFKGTAQLVERMNDNYREVYQHLAHGAQQLTDCEATLQAVYPPKIAEPAVEALPSDVTASHSAQENAVMDEGDAVVKECDGRDQAASARQAGL